MALPAAVWTDSPTVLPKSSRKPANSIHQENRQRLAGYVGFSYSGLAVRQDAPGPRARNGLSCRCTTARGPVEQPQSWSGINQFAKFLARFEEGNLLRRHFDSGSSSWIASDACSSLASVEASETADFNLIARSQGTDDAVKYR